MKKLIVWTMLASMAAGLVGCNATAMDMNRPGNATLAGAGGGALAGGAIGALAGGGKHAGKGALTGALIGGTVGGLAGNQYERNRDAQAAAYQQGAYDAQMRGGAPPPRSY